MSKKEWEEAFEKYKKTRFFQDGWWEKEFGMGDTWYKIEESSFYSNLEGVQEGWMAACEYMQEEITLAEYKIGQRNKRLKNRVFRIKELEAENAKLINALERIASDPYFPSQIDEIAKEALEKIRGENGIN